MNNSILFGTASQRFVFAVVTFLAPPLWNSTATAFVDDCITPAAFQHQGPPLVDNCTANDFGVTGISNAVVLDDGCTSPSDTITLSGTLNVNPSAPKRYDVGFYIPVSGNDGIDADQNGPQCNVFIAAINANENDGDQCGDYEGGNAALVVTVASATMACSDLTGPSNVPDGFLDVTVCSSYKQNAGTTGDNACLSYTGAVPGTGSKCRCEQIQVTPGIPVPQCSSGGCCSGGNIVAAGTTCRASTGTCDTPEICTGTSANCPADAFAATTTVCRASGGVCDVAENCTGTSGTCPADTFRATSVTCRASGGGVCDVAEMCTGTSTACPADTFLGTTTVCRAAAGVCDTAEVCSGTAATCPANSFLATTNVCRATAGGCDIEESCPGNAEACPADTFQNAGFVCRAQNGVCDVQETCAGGTAACPADGFASTATQCRGSNGVCDAAENCNGAAADCPADGFESAATVCRGANGVCDVAESCTGGSAECPADTFEPSTTTCRTGTGICDPDEQCTGGSGACPPDGFASNVTVCRDDAGECDVVETCDGAGSCPADAFEPAATSCGSGEDTSCNNPDTCDGSGTCVDNFEPTTTPCEDGAYCTSETGEPGDPDSCNGQGNGAAACEGVPVDCDNGAFCDGSETCNEGTDTCDATGDPCPDDGLYCTGTESCDEADDECESSGDPCSGAECNTCQEGTDSCFDPAATACGSAEDTDCNNPDTCDGAGSCIDNFEATTTSCEDGSFCTSDTGTPGTPDSCNGLGNGSAACAGVPVDCDNGDFCDGTEACNEGADTCDSAGDPCPDDGLFCNGNETCNEGTDTCDSSGDPCPDDGLFCNGEAVCDEAGDECDAGADPCPGTECNTCQESTDTCFDPAGTSCGDPDDTNCDNPDTCDGSGVCEANEDPMGPLCEATDLQLTKIGLSPFVQAGAFTTYELEVTNVGPAQATNVRIIDTLDPNTTYVSSDLPCSEGPVGTITCELGDMAVNDIVTIEITVYVSPAAPTAGMDSGPDCPGTEDLCNTAVVFSDSLELDPDNNTAERATDVVVPTVFADIELTKVDITAEPVQPGDNVIYRITVENNGSGNANDVVVYETLDPNMTYVSSTVSCNVTGGGTQLECYLGTIASGSSVTFDVEVTISMGAPMGGNVQDGDCPGTEDVCNSAIVGTSSSDDTFPNNRDSEPTDVAAPVSCGNGQINPGEQCDPPSNEICNNTIDDDADQLTDCADPDCVTPGFQSCDFNCQLTAPCVPILNDPAVLREDFVKVHGRYIPTTPANPFVDGFVFIVQNTDGVVFRAELLPGDLKTIDAVDLKRWRYKNNAAREARDGVYIVSIRERRERDGSISYPFKIKAYGDMSAAVKSRMTTQIYLADDVGFLTATWLGRPGRWWLTQKQASAGIALTDE